MKKQFKNTFTFSNNDINKFVLLLGKSVYSYEYMDEWEKFNETKLPEKENFYSNLKMEYITDLDYNHAKRTNHDLYLKSDTLQLADDFEKFRKMCLEIYELDPAKFLSAPRLAWQAAFKKSKVDLELLTDIDLY